MPNGILNTAIITMNSAGSVGKWHGRGAELFGLRGEVTREKFEAMREGLHPETEEFLRPRHSADRVGIDGTEQSKGEGMTI